MQNYVWIIEIWDNELQKWMPTVGAGLSRSDARREKKNDWEYNNKDDKFRVRKFVSF